MMPRCEYCGTPTDSRDEVMGVDYGHTSSHCREYLKAALGGANRENERLRAEVLEARNEAATVRRAYLHEKARADAAGADPEHAHKGPADRLWACPGCGADRTPESTPPFCEHCGNW